MPKGGKGKAGRKSRPAVTPTAAPAGGGGSVLARIDWRRMIGAVAVGCAAMLLAGVVPLPGAWTLRAVFCGLAVGLSVRTLADLAPTTAAAVLASVLGTGLIVAFSGTDPSRVPTASDVVAVVAAATVAAVIVGSVGALGRRRAAVVLALLVVLGAQAWQTGFVPGAPRDATADLRRRIAVEPATEVYAFDGDLYIRIDHLMSQGMPYYDAFMKAFDEDSRLVGPPPGLFSIRQRWLFEAWKLLPGPPGTRVLFAFDVLILVTMLFGYGLARRFVEPSAALVAPIAIAGYYLMPALSIWFPLAEFWTGALAVWFLYAMVTEKWTAGAVIVVVAFAFRELMLFLVPVYVAWFIFSRRRREGILGLALVLAGPVVLFALHSMWSPVHGQSAQQATRWLQGGLDPLKAALRFSGTYVAVSGRAYLLVPVVAMVGALMTRAWWTRVLLFTVVAVPVAALSLFSGGEFSYYWGAILMPAALALVPLAAAPLLPSGGWLLDAAPGSREPGGRIRVLLRAATAAQGSAARATIDEALPAHDHSLVSEPGAALRSAHPGDAVLFADAGAGIDAATVTRMAEAWDGGADVVVASRLAPGARTGGSLMQRFGRSAALRAVAGVFGWVYPVSGLRDYTSPLVLVSAEVLRAAPADARERIGAGGVPADLLARVREHARVREVPLRTTGSGERIAGEGFGRAARDLVAARLGGLARAGD